jgi:hypothetical protein
VSYRLSFHAAYDYDTSLSGITVPVVLRTGNKAVDVDAKIDTGATHCIFRRAIADGLCLEVESGMEKKFSMPNGTYLLTYGHELSLSVLGLTYDATVYFAKHDDLVRDVLGRNGFLLLIRLGIIDYDAKLFISMYDDQDF